MALRAVVTSTGYLFHDFAGLLVAEVTIADLGRFLFLEFFRAMAGQALVFLQRDFVKIFRGVRDYRRLLLKSARDQLLRAGPFSWVEFWRNQRTETFSLQV